MVILCLSCFCVDLIGGGFGIFGWFVGGWVLWVYCLLVFVVLDLEGLGLTWFWVGFGCCLGCWFEGGGVFWVVCLVGVIFWVLGLELFGFWSFGVWFDLVILGWVGVCLVVWVLACEFGFWWVGIPWWVCGMVDGFLRGFGFERGDWGVCWINLVVGVGWVWLCWAVSCFCFRIIVLGLLWCCLGVLFGCLFLCDCLFCLLEDWIFVFISWLGLFCEFGVLVGCLFGVCCGCDLVVGGLVGWLVVWIWLVGWFLLFLLVAIVYYEVVEFCLFVWIGGFIVFGWVCVILLALLGGFGWLLGCVVFWVWGGVGCCVGLVGYMFVLVDCLYLFLL